MFAIVRGTFFLVLFIPLAAWSQFTENKGQWPEHVICGYTSGNTFFFIERDGIKINTINPADLRRFTHILPEVTDSVRAHAIKLRWVNSVGASRFTVQEANHHKLNIIHDNGTPQFVHDVKIWTELTLYDVWPGIDVRFYEAHGALKYDFVVSEAKQLHLIQTEVQGASAVELVNNRIHIRTECGPLIESIPMAFQVSARSDTLPVSISFNLSGNRVGLETSDSSIDPTKSLIVDPELIAATFVGSESTPQENSVAVGIGANYFDDGSIFGMALISGSSANYYPITVGPYMQAAGSLFRTGLTRFSHDGSEILWSTVITSGGGYSMPLGSQIANNSVYIALGSAQSNSNNTTSAALPENHPSLVPSQIEGEISTFNPYLFILQLSSNGETLLNCRAIGTVNCTLHNQISVGSGLPNFSVCMVNDSQGNLLVCHSGKGQNHPVTPGAFDTVNAAANPDNAIDAVIMKLSPDLGTLHWCTYFGGNHRDHGVAIMVDEFDQPIIAGTGWFSSIPVTDNAYAPDDWFYSYSGYIAKLSADGSELLACAALSFPYDFVNGGTSMSGEVICFLDFDPHGNIWAYGYGANNNSDIFITENTYNNPEGRGFLCKFSPDLDELLISTRVGFEPNKRYAPTAFMVDNCGYIYTSANCSGSVSTGYAELIENAELSDDALFTVGGFYLAVYEPNVTGLQYATLMGGNHTDASYSKFDKKGVVYQAVCVPPGDISFIPTENAHATEKTFLFELGMFKIDFESPATTAIFDAQFGQQGECPPYTVDLINYSTDGQYTWFVNGEAVTPEENALVLNAPGDYEITLAVFNPETCNITDTTSKTISFPFVPHVVADWQVSTSDLCALDGGSLSAVFSGSGAESFQWSSWLGEFTDLDSLSLSFSEPGTYSLELTVAENECNTSESLVYSFTYNPLVFDADVQQSDACQLPVALNAAFTGSGASTIIWTLNGDTLALNNDVSTELPQGNHTLVVTTNSELCGALSQSWPLQALGTVDVEVAPLEITLCLGEAVALEGSISQGSASWVAPSGLLAESPDLAFAPEASMTLLFIGTDLLSCNGADTAVVSVVVVVPPAADFEAIYLPDPCLDAMEVELVFTGENAASLAWDTGDGFSYTSASVQHTYDENGVFTVTVTAEREPCEPSTAEQVIVVELIDDAGKVVLALPNIITPNGDGINDCLFFDAETGALTNIEGFHVRVFNRWGMLVHEAFRPEQRWCAHDVEPGSYFYILTYTDVCSGERIDITQQLTVKRM